jgi:ATP-dependent Lhr-like helicase
MVAQPVLTERAARREVLSRFVALAGPVSVDDVRERYAFEPRWIERRLAEWEQKQVLVRGVFGGDRATTRWCSRRLLEQARRRELAQARKQIEAVSLAAFARFEQRWQHLAPDDRVSGYDGTTTVMSQLYGLARPADGWERDYLPSRIDGYDAGSLARLAASGALVWAAEPRMDEVGVAPSHAMGRIRFFERGTGRLWLRQPIAESLLSDNARAVRDVLRSQGASFTADVSSATGLTPQSTRDALRELVAGGLATNDTVEALRDVLRWRPRFPIKRPNEPDPTRWLPAGFTPSESRPIVQRRINPRRIAKWRRPDREEPSTWGGRWSLVHTLGTLGPESDEQSLAERVARQWLARYGIVSRDWWRREHPAVGWRDIYHELKRLEFRGEVQRGYFVAGLAGAQFALPEAVELLRAPAPPDADEMVVMSVSDPANVYALPLAPGVESDPLGRPRGAGALLVTSAGRIVLVAEGRGSKVRVRDGASPAEVGAAARALAERISARHGAARRKDVVVETIDGERAAGSRYAQALRDAGFKGMGTGLRWYAGIR